MSTGSTPMSTTPSSSPYNAYFKRRSFGRPFKDDITCIYEPPSPLSSPSSSPSSSRSPSPSPSSPTSPQPSTSTIPSSLKGKSPERPALEQERERERERERVARALKREERRRRREDERRRRPSILTVRMSDGFIWNQDLFLPAHLRDRYHATSSPPNPSPSFSSFPGSGLSGLSGSFSPSSSTSRRAMSSAAQAYGEDYEVECVDIRVEDGEMEEMLHPHEAEVGVGEAGMEEAEVGVRGKGEKEGKGLGGKKKWEDSMGWDMEMECEEHA